MVKVIEGYDVAIIGAGIGGLMCGNFLAQRGIKTLICERRHMPGGYMCGFDREGFYFDSADQSFESGWVVFPLMKRLGILDQIEFVRAGYRFVLPCTNKVQGLPDAEITVDSYEGVAKQFQAAFPQDTQGIEALFREMRDVVGVLVSLFEKRDNPFLDLRGRWQRVLNILNFIGKGAPFRFNRLKCYRDMPAREMLKKFLRDERLINLLGQLGYRNWSAMNMAFAWYFWINDYWYPKGGIQAFSDLLTNTFTARGGEIRYRTRVTNIVVEGGRAMGVITQDGKQYNTKFVVSGGDYIETLTRLLDPEHLKEEEREELEKAEVSETFVTLYLGLDISPEELRRCMKTHHVYIFQGYEPIDFTAREDTDFHKKVWIELSSPSTVSPNLSPPGKSSLVVQSFSLYDWMNRWKGGSEDRTSAEYEALKEKVARDLIEGAERVIPGLSKKIILKVVGAPLSFEAFTLNTRGASAGWTWDSRKTYRGGFKEKFPGYLRCRVPLKNLYIASQWATNPAGVPMAAWAGKAVADVIGKKMGK
jgi:phytoene dehydrogenase-like protein